MNLRNEIDKMLRPLQASAMDAATVLGFHSTYESIAARQVERELGFWGEQYPKERDGSDWGSPRQGMPRKIGARFQCLIAISELLMFRALEDMNIVEWIVEIERCAGILKNVLPQADRDRPDQYKINAYYKKEDKIKDKINGLKRQLRSLRQPLRFQYEEKKATAREAFIHSND